MPFSSHPDFTICPLLANLRDRYLIDFGETPDSTWDHSLPAIWSMIEICIATICACVPSIRALLARWLPQLFDISADGAARNHPSNNMQLNTNPFPTTWTLTSRYNELDDSRFSQDFKLFDGSENGLPAFNRTAPLVPLQYEEVPLTPRTMKKIWEAQHKFDEDSPPKEAQKRESTYASTNKAESNGQTRAKEYENSILPTMWPLKNE